jgi:DNA-directed RNA polymerase subunit beta
MTEPLGSPHRASYTRFLEAGLERLLGALFPRRGGGFELHHGGIRLAPPILSERACVANEHTYCCPVWLTVEVRPLSRRRAELQTVLFGEVPLLTERDSLIIDGVERVPVGQLLVSPGVYFERRERTWYDTEHERRDHVPTWEATIRPQRGQRLRLSMTGEGANAFGQVILGSRTRYMLRQFLEQLDMMARAREVLGADQRFQQLTQAEVVGTLPPDDRQRLMAHLFEPNAAYDLSASGRERLNARLGRIATQHGLVLGTAGHLSCDDIVAALVYLLGLAQAGQETPDFVIDDLNHLKHHRLLLLGDRLETVLGEAAQGPVSRILDHGLEHGHDLDYLFGSVRGVVEETIRQGLQGRLAGSLCQVLDQTNPLAEVSHKRKVTFRGPGGIRSKYGSLTRRGVHGSHYGRLCLLETPESAHIGLNLHLATYAQVNNEGHIEAPYRTVSDGAVCVLTPEAEEAAVRGPALRAPEAAEQVLARQGSQEVVRVSPDQLTHQDLAPGQCLGLAASLVPFVQHDELNRAMMGAKNMKQAVPLLHASPPLIATGMEAAVARLSGRAVRAKRAGTITAVSPTRIVVTCQDGSQDTYELQELSPTSTATCFYQTPLVEAGAAVTPGQVLTDAAAIRGDELALGVDLLVAYMPWYGYNFEDAIVVSDRLVRTNLLTSLHLDEFSYTIYEDERVGLEPFAAWEPQTGHLYGPDDSLEGIIREGAEVGPGTVLFRKWRVAKGIVREKPHDERAPAWVRGTVVRVMRRPAGGQKTAANRPGAAPEHPTGVKEVIKLWIRRDATIAIGDKLMGRHGNKGVVGKIVPEAEMPHLEDGTPVDVVLNPHGVVSRLNLGQLYETHLGWAAHVLSCRFTAAPFQRLGLKHCEDRDLQAQVEQLLAESPSDLQAVERLLELANRHAVVRLEHGKARLFDGRTGKELAARVTVGYQYLLKLNHLVEDKLHAREEGEYAAWVEQPVKGRKAGGGQRLGEMEIWALEAHNTPELLREFLTAKSDDVITRQHVWEQVDRDRLPGYLPESLRVTAFLLRGLGLKLEVFNKGAAEAEELPYGAEIDTGNIERLRLSVATVDDIRRWGPRSVRNLMDLQPTETIVWRCACPGKQGTRKTKPTHGTCRRCGKAIRRHVLEETFAFTPDGLFGEAIFGQGDKRRHTMAHVELAAPVVNPLFIGPLSRLFGPGVRPFVNYDWVWIPETGAAMRWQAYEQQPASALQALSGADYILHLLAQRSSPPAGWDPSAAILTLLPILPPDLRPLIPRPGHHIDFDLNPLYRRVLRANARLASICWDARADAVRVHQAKRQLQRAVQALFIRGDDRRGRHYKSLGELLRGKHGILRQYLLGKRTNYSGRAVIVPGPDLTLDTCGLPASIVTGMFKRPLVEALVKQRGVRRDRAGALVAFAQPNDLEQLLGDRAVLLNRAPTLHRYNMLAFRPRLWRERAIALHPLVCGGFNADFDGDTMAIHLPLLGASRQEALRCLPSRHLLSVANGRLLLHLTQDIVAGAYSKTLTAEGRQEFAQLFDAPAPVMPKPLDKQALVDYLTHSLREYGEMQTAQRADALMRWGFAAATEAGLTLGLWDIPGVPKDQRRRLLEGLLQTQGLAWEELMDAWKQRVEQALEAELTAPNPFAIMLLSGARGKLEDACQLGGLRGLMDKLGGERFREPVDANFLEGLSPVEYFISAFGSRKTMVDKKLKTADAGDLTRRLVEAAYPLVITQEQACTSPAGSVLPANLALPGGKHVSLRERLFGRVLADDVFDKNDNRIALKGEVVASRERAAALIAAAPARGIPVRSPLTCQAETGLCQPCYGWDLSRWHVQPHAARFPEAGLPVGIIAGQCIGERGTQLTMRTFHTGGVKGEDITQGLPRVKRLVEGWLDLRLFTVTEAGHTGLVPGQTVDEWELCQVQTRTGSLPGGTESAEQTKTLRLDDFLQDRGLAELTQLFLWLMHQVYGDAIDSRHFEVILRAMLVRQDDTVRLRGVTRAALDREGFLAAASFQRALDVLVQAAVEGREDWLTGYKERLMVGQAIR